MPNYNIQFKNKNWVLIVKKNLQLIICFSLIPTLSCFYLFFLAFFLINQTIILSFNFIFLLYYLHDVYSFLCLPYILQHTSEFINLPEISNCTTSQIVQSQHFKSNYFSLALWAIVVMYFNSTYSLNPLDLIIIVRKS